MRPMMFVFVIALLMAACGRDQEPTSAPQSTAPGTTAPPEPGKSLPQPSAAELHGAPPPSDEDLGELYDISRDLQAVAAGENDAVRDLATDLARFAPSDRNTESHNRVAEAIGNALNGKRLDDATAGRLAVLLYVTLHADAMTQAQQKAASDQLRETLGAIGVARAQAEAVVSQVPQPTAR
jgi:hypothetical protein